MVAVVAVAALVAGACSGDGGDGGSASTTTTRGAAGATATTDPAIRIVLQPSRLSVGGNALPFGAPLFQVSSFLERGLGEPAEEADQQCGPGELHVIEWPTITVFVGAEGLAGWYTDDETYSTDKGIEVGSTQADLLTAYPTGAVTESSLGTEFFFDAGDGGGISALLEDGEVTTLWSGATCIAR